MDSVIYFPFPYISYLNGQIKVYCVYIIDKNYLHFAHKMNSVILYIIYAHICCSQNTSFISLLKSDI